MMDLECPDCGAEFVGVEWADGECPQCGGRYSWYEDGPYDDGDYSTNFVFQSEPGSEHFAGFPDVESRHEIPEKESPHDHP